VKSCLVIDDSRVIRKVACKLFEDLHFHAEEAEDAATALEACAHRMPDVILLDCTSPEMSCVEFLHKLRKQSGGMWPVILFSTTENDISHISEAVGSGANDFIVKPFDRRLLEAKLIEVGLL
jgi:two-component system chemotaxis response regulator CheY